MSARQKVLIVSRSSVARALLTSLLDPTRYDSILVDSLPAALRQLAMAVPNVAIVQADLVRSSADAIERLRAASGTQLPVVLADRAYVDERRASSEVAMFGAGASVPVPTDSATLEDAIHAASTGRPRPVSRPAATSEDRDVVMDAEHAARYAERLAAKIDTMDAYQVLRVARTASGSEIDAAFRQRALEYHPDRQHHLPDVATREHLYRIFKRISWALRQIGDPASRRQYDASLDARK